MTGLASEETEILLETRWHPLMAFAFFVFRTFVTIDGSTSVLPWGEHVLEVVPGTHEVQVSLGRSFSSGRMSEARIQVEVAQGKIVHLRYSAPLAYIWQEGNLEIIQ